MKLFKIIAMARKQSGLSLSQLNGKTKIPVPTLNQIETGYSKSPEFYNVQKIARALRLDWDELENAE